ncbi:hypothetical protein HYH03_014623 [Edaphochlamys debaryana]|uniref:Uncharacterized protein n=1 Tax=Edaphochlamys debaryana TaxID=47281 RepID=A0A835XVQ1_9CHLO|nr:hypothetical protein HYH03_014623 [Edaphochlamys debaryana]|eukprot:KAG2486694.1 hypothetical protein HYH03_014623 [Edaphochlamys debaryana]
MRAAAAAADSTCGLAGGCTGGPAKAVEGADSSGGCGGGCGTDDSYEAVLAARRQMYGPNTSLSYEKPIMMVRGQGTYMYDEHGTPYLDCINNVAHVGHGQPEVAAAIGSQLSTINTNSRFLHPDLPRYSSLLLASLNGTTAKDQLLDANGQPLEVVYLVCSGSEANDLALRIAMAARPGQTHVAVMGGAYHGHLSSLIPLSPYKFWGTGGGGKPPHVHVIPCPDTFRGEHLDGRRAGRAAVAAARAAGGRLGAVFVESVLSCGGQVVLPPGYLQGLYAEVRAEGAVVVADEVQCGFGRCGGAWWGFRTQDVRPDIVTMGKPIGNGYPMAALATTRALANAFAASGMEYFNTYGGSTAAVQAGMAVMRVLCRDRLPQQAEQTGAYLLAGLRSLQAAHPSLLGDVRGMGLFLGVEVVRPGEGRRHAPRTARWIKERMRARCVLLSTDGPYDNVVKMKPPMVFGRREADTLLHHLGEVLSTELTPAQLQRLEAEEDQHEAAVLAPRRRQYEENARAMYAAAEGPPAKL